MSFDGSTRIPSGNKIRCLGCPTKRGATGSMLGIVPRDSVGLARIIPTEASGEPGWVAQFCPRCHTWTEFKIVDLRRRVVAA